MRCTLNQIGDPVSPNELKAMKAIMTVPNTIENISPLYLPLPRKTARRADKTFSKIIKVVLVGWIDGSLVEVRSGELSLGS